MQHVALFTAISFSALGILLDDATTFVGLIKGYVETSPIYPYSLLVAPVFYVSFLLMLETVRVRMAPREYNWYFVLFMFVVASIAFKGFVNNGLVLTGAIT